MAYWIDLTDEIYSNLYDMWGEVGIVAYCVDNAKGPSQSYMMIL